MKNWLIIGATSGIATPLARQLAARGFNLYLADRDEQKKRLELLAKDLQVRYNAEVMTGRFEALEMDGHEDFVDRVEREFGELYGIIWVSGVMEPQTELQSDFALARDHHNVNYTAAMGVLGRAAMLMEARGLGHIVAFGSPAGDRGRKSNYLYGADKAALHCFMEGLRHRFSRKRITVLTVKPGPTDTPMTAGTRRLPFQAKPERVAQDIAMAIDRRQEVLYTPGVWRWIMLVVRHLPEFIFGRINF